VIVVPKSSTLVVSNEYSPLPFDDQTVPLVLASPAFLVLRVTSSATIKAE